MQKSSYRPKYHASVPAGWSNDPNGTIWYGGKAHLFYQHYPYKAQWGTMHWGHMVSEDLIHWETLPVALRPDEPYEAICGCCSGSAIEKGGKLWLLYTAAQPTLQRQCLAVSEDGGRSFRKDPENPILTASMLSDEISPLDFRDPRLFEKDGAYYFIAGIRLLHRPEDRAKAAALAGNPSSPEALRSPSAGSLSGGEIENPGLGNLCLCRSRDLRHWEYLGHLLEPQPEFSPEYYALHGVYECPDYFELDGYEVLLSSPQNLPQMGARYQNLHSGLYMLGKLDFGTGRFRVDTVGELDAGFDFYAAQTLKLPDGRIVMIAWKEMWDRSYPTQAEGWAGTYTLPRELRVRDGRLIQRPIRELEACRAAPITLDCLRVKDGDAEVAGIAGNGIELRCKLRPGTARRAGLRLFRGTAHETLVYADPAAGELILDRSRSGLPLGGREKDVLVRRCPLDRTDEISLELFLDVSSLELFVNGGVSVMSANVFPDPEDLGVAFFSEGGEAEFTEIRKYELRI